MGGSEPSNDKPFDKEPFDAGVEADEETDPKKFIEQLTGKLGQSLRKYNEEQGQPDFELEKFAINSLLSAAHTSQMDAEDQKDIIKKVKEGGEKTEVDADVEEPTDNAEAEIDVEEPTETPEGEVSEIQIYEMENLFVEPKKNNMFQPGSNDKLNEMKPCWKGYKQIGMKEKNGEKVPNCVPVNEESEGLWANIHAKKERGEPPAKPNDKNYPDKLTKEGKDESNNYMFWLNLKGIYDDAVEILHMDKTAVDELIADGHQWALEHIITSKDDIEEVYHFLEGKLESSNMTEGNMGESNNYMFWSSLKTITHASGELLDMDKTMVDEVLSNGHGWALDHIATSNDDIEEVYHFLANTLNAYDGDSEGGYEDEYGNVENEVMYEGKYDGKPLGKPMKGDVKKFKVYVKNKKGNVIKVNFGDPNMEIKRDNPERRKSFRARHKCSQAKDRTTPKYWSCKMWSKKPVSKMVENDSQKYNKKMIDMAHNAITRIKGKDYAPNVHEIQAWIDNIKTNKNLQISEKNSTFNKIKNMLRETFNQEDVTSPEPQVAPEPQVKPQVAPKTVPTPVPTRRNKPFLPRPNVDPNPKAISEGLDLGFGDAKPQIYHKTLSETLDTIRELVKHKGYDEIEFDINDIQHVAYGETARIRKPLFINGVENKKWLNAQIYRMDNGTYELNVYIS